MANKGKKLSTRPVAFRPTSPEARAAIVAGSPPASLRSAQTRYMRGTCEVHARYLAVLAGSCLFCCAERTERGCSSRHAEHPRMTRALRHCIFGSRATKRHVAQRRSNHGALAPAPAFSLSLCRRSTLAMYNVHRATARFPAARICLVAFRTLRSSPLGVRSS